MERGFGIVSEGIEGRARIRQVFCEAERTNKQNLFNI